VESLTHAENIIMFLMMPTLILLARVLGEIAQRYHQPAVLGEILAGILLGPTLFGVLAPEWNSWLTAKFVAATLDRVAVSSRRKGRMYI
jgi:Kef-type K+ transport system membrane component KefB